MGAMGRSWQLLKQSFAVINADVEVLLFPVMSAISALLVAATFFVPMYKIGALEAMHNGSARWDDYAILFVWYYVNFFVVIFFNSALVACANIRLSGGDPTVGDGLRTAAGRIHRIMAWTLVASTVGSAAAILPESPEQVGREPVRFPAWIELDADHLPDRAGHHLRGSEHVQFDFPVGRAFREELG